MNDDDDISTLGLHIFPLYNIEMQIHGFKQRKKKDIDINLHSIYRVKVIIGYPKGIDTFDETVNQMVRTMSQEEWVNIPFPNKPEAEEHIAKLSARYLTFQP